MIGNETWNALYDLYELLVNECNIELEYQNYFESHIVPFQILGLCQPLSFEKKSEYTLPYDDELGYIPEPDFITLCTDTSVVVVFELKTPFVGNIITSRSDGKREKLKAEAESYLSQCTEYVDSIKSRPDARDYIKKQFGLDSISDIQIKLIYGLSTDNNTSAVEKLMSTRKTPSSIIHFDTLVDKLSNHYVRETQIPIGGKGLTAVYHIRLSSEQLNERCVISEGVSSSNDRVVLEYINGKIQFTIRSHDGVEKCLQSEISCNENTYLRIEFCSSESGTFMCLMVNNMAQEIWVSKMNMNYTYDQERFTLGASCNGENGACFSIYEHYLLSTISKIKDRLGSYHYFKRKKESTGACIVFMGNQFLSKNENNSLAQDVAAHQPKQEESTE